MRHLLNAYRRQQEWTRYFRWLESGKRERESFLCMVVLVLAWAAVLLLAAFR